MRTPWSLSTLHIPFLVGRWLLERISHLSRKRRIMATKKKIRLILTALLSLSGVLPAAATDYQASDYLPLAVGNSWTYEHEYHGANVDLLNYAPYWDQWPALDEPFIFPEFTIEVLHTEVIDGKTYYVISDMPADWPPAPPHFIAGKKLRWEGTHLMERTDEGEQATFRFDATSADYTWPTTDRSPLYYLLSNGITAYRYRAYLFEISNLFRITYLVSTTEGNDQVSVEAGLKPVPWYYFTLDSYAARKLSHDPDWDFVPYRSCNFLAGYGVLACEAGKFSVLTNYLVPLRAVIGGTPVEFADALIPTGISPSSWGQIKQSWSAGERSGQ